MIDAKVNAPDFNGAKGWLNTDRALSIKDLRGKIVLLDFWTFCCINCMHIIPDLHKLESKYANELVVIGVHSAKFDNEKDSNQIKEAILRYNIEHPVINDADFTIWNEYAVKAWPTLVLIDPDGKIVMTAAGEGHIDDLDKNINSLIKTFGARGKLDRKPLHLATEKHTAARLSSLAFPGKIAADPVGKRLFVSDSGHNRIVILEPNGKTIATIGSGTQGAKDGKYEVASFNHPQGLAYDGASRLYVADTENNLIRCINLKNQLVSTIAGTGKQAPFRAQGWRALSSALNSPWDLLVRGQHLYIAMAGAHQIWELDLDSHVVVPVIGNGGENIVDGPFKEASLAQPSGITTDGKILYFADSEVSAVRSAELKSGGKVATLVGEGLFQFGDVDGIGAKARLQHPLGIVWHDGLLYVADSYNHKIKTIDPSTRECKTFEGNGKSGYVDGKNAQFAEPSGLCFLGDTLYVADTNNSKIRKIDLQTKDVSTLETPGLRLPSAKALVVYQPEPTSRKMAGTAQPIEIKQTIQLKPNTSGTLQVNLHLPKGFHQNLEAPARYTIDQTGNAVDLGSNLIEKTLQPPKLSFSVPLKTFSETSKSLLSIIVPVYYCTEGDNAVCLLTTVMLKVPIVIDKTSDKTDALVEHEISVTAP